MDILVQALEPWLVRNHPCSSCGREKAPTVSLVKTFGAVVTKVELSKITFVITIGETA